MGINKKNKGGGGNSILESLVLPRTALPILRCERCLALLCKSNQFQLS
jgi:hypothetical protein